LVAPGAKRAAAARGELRTPLPVGYLHDEQGATVIDPDEEVAGAVADVFAAFTATGSAYQVVAAFAGRRFPLRAYGGVWAGAQRLYAEELPSLPLFFRSDSFILPKWLSGVRPMFTVVSSSAVCRMACLITPPPRSAACLFRPRRSGSRPPVRRCRCRRTLRVA